jgi:two-component system, response regulator PdtaR
MRDPIVAGQFVRQMPHLAMPADAERGGIATARPTVLIVEDDFLVATDLEHALRDAGFEVAGVAISAFEAIQLVKKSRVTVAVVDVRLMGERDGVDTALELFRDYDIRCIFATAHADEQTRSRAAAASPLGWIAKPYNPQAIIEALNETHSN